MTQGLATAVRNRLLRALPPSDRSLVLSLLEPVALAADEVLVEPGRPIGHVWFLESGIGSTTALCPDGQRVEVASLGREGMAGHAALQGAETSPLLTAMHAPGRALRARAGDLRHAMEASPGLRDLLGRYMQVVTVQAAHAALANGRFSIDERVARWILMAHDRSDEDGLRLTHDVLARALGVRRPGVTTAIHVLEGRGLVRATRGQVAVLDRAGLEEAAGGSYGAPEAEYERLIGCGVRMEGPAPAPLAGALHRH